MPFVLNTTDFVPAAVLIVSAFINMSFDLTIGATVSFFSSCFALVFVLYIQINPIKMIGLRLLYSVENETIVALLT
ncbi:MAG TPA: hypothetical protein PLY81_10450 [Chitinophagaceae bacterium]|nr:hypothetical protein [Chitinophagaceae bacterium]